MKTLEQLRGEIDALQDEYLRRRAEEEMANYDIRIGDEFTFKKGHNCDGLRFKVTGLGPHPLGGYAVEGVETKATVWEAHYLESNWDRVPRA